MAWKGIIMEPEAKRVFVEALRSGKYPQTRNFLGKIMKGGAWRGLCCLGVFCVLQKIPYDMASPGTPRAVIFDFGSEKSSRVPSDDWFAGHLRIEETGAIPGSSYASFIMSALTTKNDNGVTFEEIAKWVEENL